MRFLAPGVVQACSLAAVMAVGASAVSCVSTTTTTAPAAGAAVTREPGRPLTAEQARARALAESRLLESQDSLAPGEAEPEAPPAAAPPSEAAPPPPEAPEPSEEAPPPPEAAGPPAPGEAGVVPAPAGAGDGERERLVEEHLRSVLEAERRAQVQAVQSRIFYPDELFGAPMVRTETLEPGMVMFYYPLRATGGIKAKIDDMNVTAQGPDDASVTELINNLKQYLDADANEEVSHYKNLNMLQITAREENVPFILDVLAFLDSPRKQVILEAAVWEITETKDRQLAASVSIAVREGGRTFSNCSKTGSTPRPFSTA